MATATVPSGPVDADAQASAAAVPAGAPTNSHATVNTVNTRMTEPYWVGSGRCTQQIMNLQRAAARAGGGVLPRRSERGATQVPERKMCAG
ncbi:hypothetical protein ACIPSE_27220 [Streptomyces sp. NPDC090106]|uniref:hypothetical protein n=1 Tax=Streptomyces sp. NPDC090106 TaxID=3365946 RepID=UPI00381EC7C5